MAEPDIKKDYRGIPCPLNYVRLLAVLEEMQPRQTVEVILDDGDPVRNVTKSIEADGHRVLLMRPFENAWKLVVEKSAH